MKLLLATLLIESWVFFSHASEEQWTAGLDQPVDRSDWVNPQDMGMPSIPNDRQKVQDHIDADSFYSQDMGVASNPKGGQENQNHEEETKQNSIHNQDMDMPSNRKDCLKVQGHPDSCSQLQDVDMPSNPKDRQEHQEQISQEESELKSMNEKLQENLSTCLRSKQILEEKLELAQYQSHSLESLTLGEKRQMLFLTRHVRFLLNILDSDPEDIDSGNKHGRAFHLNMIVTEEHLKVFRLFSEEQNNFADLDHTLSELFENLHPMEHAESRMESVHKDYISMLIYYMPSSQDLFWIFTVLCSTAVLASVWFQVPVWKITITVILVSSMWHWTHLYKKAMTKKHSTLIKNLQVPPECFPSEMSWSHLVYNTLFVREDKCQAYHEALMVDPLWEVSPTMAVAETISQFVLLPLEHLGTAIGRFFAALLGEVSWISSPAILLFVFIAFLLLIIILSGYRFRLPFFLGTLEPSRDTYQVNKILSVKRRPYTLKTHPKKRPISKFSRKALKY